LGFATKWVKRHGFSNSLIISRICLFWLVCNYKGPSQNPKCVVVFCAYLHKSKLISFHIDDPFRDHYIFCAYLHQSKLIFLCIFASFNSFLHYLKVAFTTSIQDPIGFSKHPTILKAHQFGFCVWWVITKLDCWFCNAKLERWFFKFDKWEMM
jgi:hypothetical protein